MKNFIYISPHFPDHFHKFVTALKNAGFNVLGIGDCNFDSLSNELKRDLTEYYACYDMENFDCLKNAVSYFVNKYGYIDYLESNNEYWLPRDAKLRSIFNINGVKEEEINEYNHKSLMKKHFEEAGVKTAPWILFDTKENLEKFINKFGYPIFIKPDCGVGADGDFKIESDDDLNYFLENKNPNITYICESFITGNIVSFDGVANSKSEIVFCTNDCFPPSIADILKQQKDLFYYGYPGLMKGFETIGPKVIKAFKVKNRFFHIEFFVLTKKNKGFAEKGEIVALETNMRPAGGYTTDVINFANSIDCYKIYAETLMNDTSIIPNNEKFYCACASRKEYRSYLHSENEIFEKYNLCAHGNYPKVFSGVMGDKYYLLKCKTLKEMKEFKEFVETKV